MIRQSIEGVDYIHDMVSITYELTYACDKSCSYCYNPQPRFAGANLATKDKIWEKIMSVERPLQVLLLGGETTLHKHVDHYWNSYVEKFKDDTTKTMALYTHGNNKTEVYERFIGGKEHSFLGFSYHPGQTDEDLYFKNMETVRKNGVNVVSCQVLDENKENWAYNREILKRVKELGGTTQLELCVTSENSRNTDVREVYDYFGEYMFRCYKIKNLHFNGPTVNTTILRDDYNLEFPNGLSSVKKTCWNKVFKIDVNGKMMYECEMGKDTHSVDLAQDLDAFDDFIKLRGVTCTQVCPGIASTFNEKLFYADSIGEIKG